MRGNRRILWVIGLLVLAASSPLAAQVAFDFGGTLRNQTGYDAVDSFVQKDRVSAWLELRGPKTLFELTGAYTLSVADAEVSHLADVERLSLTSTVTGDGAPLSRFDFTLGRQRVVDHTGLVLNQAVDGIGLSVAYPVAKVTASVGTTFLPNKGTVPVILSRGDAADSESADVLMGNPRVIGLVEVVFPRLLRQQLTLSVSIQEDLRTLFETPALESAFDTRSRLIAEGETAQDPTRGGLLDTQYMSLGLRGNIVGGLFYNAFGTLGTGRTLSYITPEDSVTGTYTYTPIVSALVGVGLNYYAEKLLGSVAGLRFVLSTGDTWNERTGIVESSVSETPTLFLPVTALPVSPVLRASLGNLSFLEMSYSMRPFVASGADLLSRLQVGLTGLIFIRPSAGPISVPVPNTDVEASAYLGSELDLRVTWRPFADLGVDVLGGLFLPNGAENGAFFGDSALQWRAEASVSLDL